MSKYYVEVPTNGELVSSRIIEADFAEVEFGVLRFHTKGTGIVAAFNQWNSFRPDEVI